MTTPRAVPKPMPPKPRGSWEADWSQRRDGRTLTLPLVGRVLPLGRREVVTGRPVFTVMPPVLPVGRAFGAIGVGGVRLGTTTVIVPSTVTVMGGSPPLLSLLSRFLHQLRRLLKLSSTLCASYTEYLLSLVHFTHCS